jgi:DNA primase
VSAGLELNPRATSAKSTHDRIPLIIERVDLNRLVTELTGSLGISSGTSTKYSCPNPDHDDHVPSFTVQGKYWHCWSQCGARGDAIDLLTFIGLVATKANAIEYLADRAGLHRGPAVRSSQPVSPNQERLLLARYAENRSWDSNVTTQLGMSVVRDSYGHLRIRHPFRLRGEIVGWQDRVVDEAVRPRWLFPRGRIRCPYEANRLQIARIRGDVIVTEGVTDTIAIIASVENPAVVGVPGAGTFKKAWAPAFSDLKVFVVGDNDKAGAGFRSEVESAVRGTAKAVVQVDVPAPFGDVSDWLVGIGDRDEFAVQLAAAFALAEGVLK